MQAQSTRDRRAFEVIRSFADRLGGEGPGGWTFDGQPISDEVAFPLLILTDNLNELEAGRFPR